MSTDIQSPDAPATVGIGTSSLDDYGAFTTMDGEELLLYRRTNDAAWLQSTHYVSLAETR